MTDRTATTAEAVVVRCVLLLIMMTVGGRRTVSRLLKRPLLDLGGHLNYIDRGPNATTAGRNVMSSQKTSLFRGT
jgi:hypothetical protein